MYYVYSTILSTINKENDNYSTIKRAINFNEGDFEINLNE